MRYWTAGALTLFLLSGTVLAEENPRVVRGGVMGPVFSEVGKLYVDHDNLIHFRTDQRLYYFSHMYYIWDALAAAGAVKDGKIIYDLPLRITGNYSKAQSVYNFLEEPELRGSQIMWIDRVEKVDLPTQAQSEWVPLFDGDSLKGWSILPAAATPTGTAGWKVKRKALSGLVPGAGASQTLISESVLTDFELTFEYRSSWRTSASLLLRANTKGAGIALSLDHIDEGTIGFPKSAAGGSRPFMLYETREERGVGASAHFHLQYDGRFNYDAITRDKLLQCCQLIDFLKEWDGAFWNILRIRCAGPGPEITVWINSFQISQFNASAVVMSAKNPAHVGTIENYEVHPSGRIGFALHAALHQEPEFLLREVRVRKLK
jgi:Domain of Unknown Function (DUF1080)